MSTEETDEVARSGLSAFELFSSEELSATVQIRPCRVCDPWHVEAEPMHGGRVVIREWHDEDCTHLQSLLMEDVGDAD